MDGRSITRKEQSCIANCIFTHWGDSEHEDTAEQRDQDYEKCLNDCQICA